MIMPLANGTEPTRRGTRSLARSDDDAISRWDNEGGAIQKTTFAEPFRYRPGAGRARAKEHCPIDTCRIAPLKDSDTRRGPPGPGKSL